MTESSWSGHLLGNGLLTVALVFQVLRAMIPPPSSSRPPLRQKAQLEVLVAPAPAALLLRTNRPFSPEALEPVVTCHKSEEQKTWTSSLATKR